jgi:hypothetical protein
MRYSFCRFPLLVRGLALTLFTCVQIVAAFDVLALAQLRATRTLTAEEKAKYLHE